MIYKISVTNRVSLSFVDYWKITESVFSDFDSAVYVSKYWKHKYPECIFEVINV